MEKQYKEHWIRFSLNILLIIIFAVVITFISIRYGPAIAEKIKTPEDFRNLLLSYGDKSVLVFIAFQIIQVIIAVIPGEVTQLAGGFVFGTFFGTIYSLIGITVGSILVFFISRLLGYSLIKMLLSPKAVEKFEFLAKSKKAERAVFILFLIPGLPKDILTYIAGFAPVNPVHFIVAATIGRIPGILASSYIGSHLQKQNYMEVIIGAVVVVAVFAVGVAFKDKIIHTFKKDEDERKNTEE